MTYSTSLKKWCENAYQTDGNEKPLKYFPKYDNPKGGSTIDVINCLAPCLSTSANQQKGGIWAPLFPWFVSAVVLEEPFSFHCSSLAAGCFLWLIGRNRAKKWKEQPLDNVYTLASGTGGGNLPGPTANEEGVNAGWSVCFYNVFIVYQFIRSLDVIMEL